MIWFVLARLRMFGEILRGETHTRAPLNELLVCFIIASIFASLLWICFWPIGMLLFAPGLPDKANVALTIPVSLATFAVMILIWWSLRPLPRGDWLLISCLVVSSLLAAFGALVVGGWYLNADTAALTGAFVIEGTFAGLIGILGLQAFLVVVRDLLQRLF
ncbi:MAG: hypothetical protein ACFB0Z_02610 [Candidatus Phaeomarinobacter sp.]